MLSADGEAQVRVRGASLGGRQFDEPSHSLLVDALERVVHQDSLLKVRGDEGPGVIAGDSKRHLRQVVRPVREELAKVRAIIGVAESGDLVGDECSTRDFDHGSDLVLDVHAALLLDLFGRFLDLKCLLLEFGEPTDERDHDAREWLGVGVLLQQVGSSVDDCFHLHGCQLWTDDRQAASTQAEHGVFLVEVLDIVDQILLVRVSQLGGQVFVDLSHSWQEFVKRRIQHADCDWQPVHRREDVTEVRALEVLDLGQAFSLENPAAHNGETFRCEEHVLSAR
mmetsp:Transcript_5850/g.17445  ORF Transcript_5850/g.17445 Transcript_5850/m.17445 type:complete len:281 (+) Transcript_5850:440-1282(+)